MMIKNFHINTIVIPYDFSETAALALDHGVFLAKLYRAEIYLVHVIETFTFTSAIAHAFSKAEFESQVEEQAIEKLKELADNIHHKSGIRITPYTEVGRIYKKIISSARELKANIILMGTHGVSGFQEFFMGSNAYRVVSDSPCPVITVQTHSTRIGFKRIVLPIDDSTPSRQKVPYAAELASKYNSHVFIAGIMSHNEESFVRKFKIKVEQVEEFLDKHQVMYSTQYLYGTNLAALTMKYATDVNGDLIIIMTEQEENLTGLFLGTYAQQVVNHSKIPVMSIRPAESDPDKVVVGL